MSVIRFPVNRAPQDSQEAAPTPFISVAAALHALGEPATATEISRLLAAEPSGFWRASLAEVTEVLVAGSRAGTPWADGLQVFRAVELRGRQAWAFTTAFRTLLSQGGVDAALRPLELDGFSRSLNPAPDF